jgi:hypothetical protein
MRVLKTLHNYVEMVTTEKPINVCYKTALECEESIE